MKILLYIGWLISILFSVGPILVNMHIDGFFEISEVCVGIPIVKRVKAIEKSRQFEITTYGIYDNYVDIENSSFLSRSLERISSSKFSDGFWILNSTTVTNNICYNVLYVYGHKVASYMSIVVFIGFNLVCFITLALFYIRIFRIASNSSKSVQSSAKRSEYRMALKMSAVVITDFLCWVPVALVCLFVQCGVLTVGPDIYAWTVGLILPINSSINPFLYTFAVVIADRLEKK